jgi:hypothetical protein
LGRLLKRGFIAAQNLKQHGKTVQKFSKLAKNLRQFAENLRKCFQDG